MTNQPSDAQLNDPEGHELVVNIHARKAAQDAVIEAMIEHGPDGHIDGYQQITDAALKAAAPFFKPQEITTAQELDALPNEALIRTRFGQVLEAAKLTDGENIWRTLGPAKVIRSEDIARWSLPATVLYVGGVK